MICALLPLKDFVNAKQRLSGVLSATERRHLFHCMVEDVLQLLSNHPLIQRIVVVSDDPSAELLADRFEVEFLAESSLAVYGLNAVVNAAALRLQKQGVKDLMVVHGDLPLLTASSVSRLIAEHQSVPGARVTLAPDRHQQGSNIVLCTPPTAIEFQYGCGSFQRHGKTALHQGLVLRQLSFGDVACDIDNPEDLLALIAHERSDISSARYLQRSGIAERLITMKIGVQDDSFAMQRSCGDV